MTTIRRVPVDFDWPLNQVWDGFLSPNRHRENPCTACGESGYSSMGRHLKGRWYGYVPFRPEETGSTPLTIDTLTVRAFAARNVASSPAYYGSGEAAIVREAQRLCDLWNGMWCHHLAQVDVDALIEADRLIDFTHTWVPGKGWQRIDPPPVVTAADVNTWSLRGFGHDSINCVVVVEAACERAERSVTCPVCEGHGSTEAYPGQRAEAKAWKPTEPPTGDGWQAWEDVSEGSPISPVFPTRDGLVEWFTTPASVWGARTEPLTRAQAEALVDVGDSVGSFVTTGDGRAMSGDAAVHDLAADQ